MPFAKVHQLFLLLLFSIVCERGFPHEKLDILVIPLSGVSSDNPADNESDLFLDKLYRLIESRLEALVNSPELKGASVSGRSYPDSVSELINKGFKLGVILEFSTSTYGTNLISMVSQRRVDYAIDYASTIYQENKSEHIQDKQGLQEVPILQNVDQNEIGLYCSGGNPKERELVSQRLNEVAIDLALEAEAYRRLYSSYKSGVQKDRLLERLEVYLNLRPNQGVRSPY